MTDYFGAKCHRCPNRTKEDDMYIKDEVYPKFGEVRLAEHINALWIKVPDINKFMRVVIEDGSHFCWYFYKDDCYCKELIDKAPNVVIQREK